MQQGKMVVWGGLTKSWEKEEKRKAKEKRKNLNVEFERIARTDKKAFLSEQWKEIEENNRRKGKKKKQNGKD